MTYLDEDEILRLYKVTRAKLVAVFRRTNMKRKHGEFPSERNTRLDTEIENIIKGHQFDSLRLLLEGLVSEATEEDRKYQL